MLAFVGRAPYDDGDGIGCLRSPIRLLRSRGLRGPYYLHQFYHLNILHTDQDAFNANEWNSSIVDKPFGLRHYEVAAFRRIGPFLRPPKQPAFPMPQTIQTRMTFY